MSDPIESRNLSQRDLNLVPGSGEVCKSGMNYELLAILALPFLFLLAGPNWVLDQFGQQPYIDPYVYFGFFLEWPSHLKAFPGTYYGSRLSWILPGYLTYKCFPPVAAAYVLHLSFYYAAVLSLYLILRQTVGKKAALLSAAMMGGYGYFLWAIGSEYVDGAGITYFLLTTLMLTYAATRSPRWHLLGGAFYGAMIYSQLFLVVLTPSLLLYGLAINAEECQHSIKKSALYSATGLLMITSVLGAVHRALGGDFLFFRPSIETAIRLSEGPNPWFLPFSTWWRSATWLVFPCAMVLASIVFVSAFWHRRSAPGVRLLILFQAYFLTIALVLLFFQLKGNPILQVDYYASFLLPAAFLALGAQLAPTVSRFNRSQFVLLLFGIITVLLLAYHRPSIAPRWSSYLAIRAPEVLLAIVVMGGLLLARRPRWTIAVLLPVFTLGLVNVANSHFRDDPNIGRTALMAIVDSVKLIHEAEPSGEAFFWYRATEPMGALYTSVASTYLWGYRVVNERFPSLTKGPDSSRVPSADKEVVILTNDNDPMREAETSLRSVGLGAQLLSEHKVQVGSLGWNVLLIRLNQLP